jgi:hypothetical protein
MGRGSLSARSRPEIGIGGREFKAFARFLHGRP